ncbi:transcriptional regulator GutM [uncultured Anaerococcus sp.]|uniref:transcriptional regulator GutM n=1 Tax=uncultured Anaerococcus sp. TaxID=293428 RepID=UPI0025E6BBF4|nr:transcriptional regulator GutM [uncultured Anaerococcus sp.]
MIKDVVIILLFIIICQGVLGIYQLKKYDKFIKNLQTKYKGLDRYYLLSERAGNKFQSLILIVIMDNSYNIIEAYSYSGYTVFSSFKNLKSIENKNINDLLNNRASYENMRNLNAALDKVKVKYDETIGEKVVN